MVRLIGYYFKHGFVDETTKRPLRIDALSTTLNVLRVNGIDIALIMANESYSIVLWIHPCAPFAPPLTDMKVSSELIRTLSKADPDKRFIGFAPFDTL
jgi:hypothetical protein